LAERRGNLVLDHLTRVSLPITSSPS
jgi:hypothetical protein